VTFSMPVHHSDHTAKSHPLTHFLPSNLCTGYFCVHCLSQNNRKIHVNFAKHMFKTCSRKLPVTSLADFLSKEISKAVSNSKTQVSTRILATSARSELVKNELKPILGVQSNLSLQSPAWNGHRCYAASLFLSL
jgi:hypothetical protein